MDVNYSRTPQQEDAVIYQAAKEGSPIRIRLQPTVLLGGGPSGYRQHRQWTSVRWLIDVVSPLEAFELRDTLQAFFTALQREGAASVRARLNGGAHVSLGPGPRGLDNPEAPGEDRTASAPDRE